MFYHSLDGKDLTGLGCQMPGPDISGGPAAAVLLLLAPGRQGTEILFTLRASHLSHHAGEVSFPGGAREPQDTDLLATALRETREETGLEETPDCLARLETVHSITGMPVVPYVAWLPERPVLVAAPEEVEEVFWVPCRALTTQNPGYRYYERLGKRRAIPFYEYERWVIWGMTGLVLKEFLEHLNNH